MSDLDELRQECADLTQTLRAVDAVMADALERFVEIEQSADMDDLRQRRRDDEQALTTEERELCEAFQELFHVALLVNYRADYWAGGSIVPNPSEAAERYNLPDEFVKYARGALNADNELRAWDRSNLRRIAELERQVFELVTDDLDA